MQRTAGSVKIKSLPEYSKSVPFLVKMFEPYTLIDPPPTGGLKKNVTVRPEINDGKLNWK